MAQCNVNGAYCSYMNFVLEGCKLHQFFLSIIVGFDSCSFDTRFTPKTN